MKGKIWSRLDDPPSKGGLIGALIGVLVSVFYQKKDDKPLKNAGKTALFGGTGFILGEWFERVFIRKSRNHS